MRLPFGLLRRNRSSREQGVIAARDVRALHSPCRAERVPHRILRVRLLVFHTRDAQETAPGLSWSADRSIDRERTKIQPGGPFFVTLDGSAQKGFEHFLF
jgi:hypothetical protein